MNRSVETSPATLARVAGFLYLIIIACGLFGELGVRSRLVVPDDAAATAANILASEGLFRIGFACDLVMTLSDVVLAGVLYVLFRPVSRALALVAVSLRLVQSAILGANLMNYFAPLLVLGGAGTLAPLGTESLQALAFLFLETHRHGYDLALVFFGVHCAVLGYLLVRSGYVPKALGVLVGLASVGYLVGSFTLFLFPERVDAVAPIYALPLLAEVALCLWLLIRGVRVPAGPGGDAPGRP